MLMEPNFEVFVFTLVLGNTCLIVVIILMDTGILVASNECEHCQRIGHQSSNVSLTVHPRSILAVTTQDYIFLAVFVTACLFLAEGLTRVFVIRKKIRSQPLDMLDSIFGAIFFTAVVACLSSKPDPLITDAVSFTVILRLVRFHRISHGATSLQKAELMETIEFHRREDVFHVEKVKMMQQRLDNYELEIDQLKELITRATAMFQETCEQNDHQTDLEGSLTPTIFPPNKCHGCFSKLSLRNHLDSVTKDQHSISSLPCVLTNGNGHCLRSDQRPKLRHEWIHHNSPRCDEIDKRDSELESDEGIVTHDNPSFDRDARNLTLEMDFIPAILSRHSPRIQSPRREEMPLEDF